jgi:hypothetical protein
MKINKYKCNFVRFVCVCVCVCKTRLSHLAKNRGGGVQEQSVDGHILAYQWERNMRPEKIV